MQSVDHTLSGVVRELAAQPDSDVAVVCEGGISESRRQLGWTPPSVGKAEVIMIDRGPWRRQVREIIQRRNDGVHLFNGGMSNYPRVHFAFFECCQRGIMTGIVSEPPVNQESGWRRWAKALYIRALPFRILPLARRARFLLALTHPEDDTFLRLGWQRHKIYPFGYFSEIVPTERVPQVSHGIPALIYVGHFRWHKALGVLIRAASLVRSQGNRFRIDLYGSGPVRAQLAEQIERDKLVDTVFLRPPIPHDQVPCALRRADVLVAPGLIEPWGFAVNEGIQAGLAVIVSDGIRGGGSLVRNGRCGEIVRAGDAQDLARAITTLVTDRDRLLQYQRRAWQYSSQLSPRSAAGYLTQIIEFERGERTSRPVAPWIVETS
jgi:glycosyltransferase involved in cell wall biosynthesis